VSEIEVEKGRDREETDQLGLERGKDTIGRE
jgi:hypothetical protein